KDAVTFMNRLYVNNWASLAVVINEAIIAQEHTITASPNGEARPVVHVQAVHECHGVFADDFDLAQRRAIEESAALASCEALACDCCVHVLAPAGEVAST